MKFVLRALTSVAVGLAVYLLMLCEPKSGQRHLIDLFMNPDKFFQSFDWMTNFDVMVSGTFGIIIGICVFIFLEGHAG